MSEEAEPKPIHPLDKKLFARIDAVTDETEQQIEEQTAVIERVSDVLADATEWNFSPHTRHRTTTIPQLGSTALSVQSELLN